MTVPHLDFHIHTKYLKCANETMEVAAIVRECERLGVTALGITDHLNTLDKLPLHRPIREDIEALETTLPVYFGVELNYTGRDAGFAYSEAVRDELGFQFAIGGIHSTYLERHDVQEIVEIQHRHHLKTCADPLVSVLVHPYWFGRGEFDKKGWPWFDRMSVVPAAFARELGQAARDSGTAIEINGCANLDNKNYDARYVAEYREFLATVAAEGRAVLPRLGRARHQPAGQHPRLLGHGRLARADRRPHLASRRSAAGGGPMIIALASPAVAAQLEDGLERVRRLVAEASAQGAEIVCFPKAYLPGLRGQDLCCRMGRRSRRTCPTVRRGARARDPAGGGHRAAGERPYMGAAPT